MSEAVIVGLVPIALVVIAFLIFGIIALSTKSKPCNLSVTKTDEGWKFDLDTYSKKNAPSSKKRS
ncbi:MAG: hypothetical protein ACLTK7_06045 [Clostridium paraputrificum]